MKKLEIISLLWFYVKSCTFENMTNNIFPVTDTNLEIHGPSLLPPKCMEVLEPPLCVCL